MTDKPIIGFTGYTWKVYRRCVICKRKIKDGVVNVHHVGHEHEVEFRCMCWPCYHDLMKRTEGHDFQADE